MTRKRSEAEQQRVEEYLRNDRRFYARVMFAIDDLATIVEAHAYIEVLLERLLERSMKRKDIVDWHAIDMLRRLKIARALGEISDDEATTIQKVTEMRNRAAHDPGAIISEEDVAGFAAAMRRVEPDAMRGIQERELGPYVQAYGAHGRILRLGLLFLKWRLRGHLTGTPSEPLDYLDIAEELFSRPLSPGPHKIADPPYDRNGVPRAPQQ